jgi:protein AATF/BFR2
MPGKKKKKAMTLSERMTAMSNPAPGDEDSYFRDTEGLGRVLGEDDELYGSEQSEEETVASRSTLRRDADTVEMGAGYEGKVANRADLFARGGGSSSGSGSDSDSDSGGESSSGEEDAVNDRRVAELQQYMQQQQQRESGEEEDSDEDDLYGRNGMDNLPYSVQHSGGSEDDDEDDDEDSLDDEALQDAVAGADVGIDVFQGGAQSKQKVKSDRARARHVRTQRELYDKFLSLRIAVQGPLSLSNRLPKSGKSYAQHRAGKEEEQGFTDVSSSLRGILNELTLLSSSLISNNPQLSSVLSASDHRPITPTTSVKDIWKKSVATQYGCMGNKASLTHQNDTLSHWDRKTVLAGGKSLLQKDSLKVFNRDVVAQIESVTSNMEDLVRRSQLKRNEYTIVGEENAADAAGKKKTKKKNADAKTKKKDLPKDEYEPEIFDDNDFYADLIGQFLRSRNADGAAVGDEVRADAEQLRAARRRRANATVDRKASKGRRLRYTVMPKLQNFLAPTDRHDLNFAADELFANLFGSGAGSKKRKRPASDEGDGDSSSSASGGSGSGSDDSDAGGAEEQDDGAFAMFMHSAGN